MRSKYTKILATVFQMLQSKSVCSHFLAAETPSWGDPKVISFLILRLSHVSTTDLAINPPWEYPIKLKGYVENTGSSLSPKQAS